MVTLDVPVFVKVTGWLLDWPTGTPPNQMLVCESVRVRVAAGAKFAVEIRKTPMAMLIETSLPRALGGSELMTRSFNG